VSLAWGAVVAVAAYAVVRATQFFAFPDPNPAALVWSAHAGYFWRSWIVGYAGGMAAFIAYPLVRSRPDSAARALAGGVAVAAAAIALEAAFVP
jgi:hypothetical protein